MQAYIADGIRTAIGSLGETLSTVRADDLAVFVIKKLMERSQSISTEKIVDVIMGCDMPLYWRMYCYN